MKRSVIYVVESGGVSGGVRVILEHLNRLRARGWHVEVYSLDSGKPGWFPLNPGIPWFRFENYDVLMHHLSKRNAIKVATWWKTAFAVSEASKEGEGFYFVQDIETHYYSAPAQKKVVESTYGLGLTQFTDSWYAHGNLPSCEFIGLGIDRSLYRVMSARRQLNAVLSLSRPQHLKGWSDLCELYRRLYQTKQFALFSFGSTAVHPPYSAPLPPGMSDEELVKQYNRCGIFVSTSLHEGFSLTPLEAMACGAVVVTTNADGNMVYCEDRKNCLIVNPGDVSGIIDACLLLQEDSDLLMALQEGGLETADEWPWDPVIDRLEAIYG